MKVTCAECATSFMLDDLLVGARGARVRCTECGTVFRVQPAMGNSLAELGAALPDEPWRVQQGAGQLQFASVSDLSRAILAGQVHENDILSRGLQPARRVGEVLELLSFFARARRPDPDERIQTLPGLADPSQRAVVEHARAEIERLKAASRVAAEPARPESEPAPPTEPELRPDTHSQHDLEQAGGAASELQGGDVAAALVVPELVPGLVPELVPGLVPEPEASEPVPEAAVSPPFLPEDSGPELPASRAEPRAVHDVSSPVPPAAGWLYGGSEQAPPPPDAPPPAHARQARLRTAVVSVLAAAAVVLLAGLGARSLRAQRDPEKPRPVAAAQGPAPTPNEEPALAVAMAPVTPAPVAAAASGVGVAPHAPPIVEPEPVGASVASVASTVAGSESHRGDPQNLPTVDPRRMVADGARALRRGELGKAEEAFQRAINKNPYDSEALSGLGDLARIRGHHDKAREIYAQVLSVNPSYLPALLALADLSWGSGDRAEARRGYEYIVGHYPESAYPARVKQRAAEEASP